MKFSCLAALQMRGPQSGSNRPSLSPLIRAANGGHGEIIKSLLQFGADRTLKDHQVLTAKDVAIKNGNDDLVALLS
jgi:ankyrin repeat protein